MDLAEFLILILSAYYTAKSIKDWYKRLPELKPAKRDKAIKYVVGLLPVVSFFIILYTLKFLASFDVVNDRIYIIFYILLGYAWTFLGMKLVFLFFDISWIDDVLGLNNKAALFAVSGSFLGLVVIYSGANIGDGPGWWCVLFAGGLGLITWFLLGRIIHSFTQAFERITIDRDIGCGIRIGTYLLASGIILARASAGDWTSFYSTIVEFLVGWPVLVLTILAIIVERYYIQKTKLEENSNNIYLSSSLCCSIIYLIFAAMSVTMYPLVENPSYDDLAAFFLGVVL
ncbi:hypothetical protein [Acetivibrio clariflavus]|uniref:Uncharacterized protein n=1 Tax=Acetivibrio clariflavus (strain DSM 19732 / NBRC 101661 / EBR45) TaxID=720554 RepID=G8LXF4_ACECE|nr:hypothetical protein [Acetivibrio clariflavus]AEV69872.1 hypothetical protein Clocl_3374 [Acetivibrio clariflavus DSM 19732]